MTKCSLYRRYIRHWCRSLQQGRQALHSGHDQNDRTLCLPRLPVRSEGLRARMLPPLL